MNDYETMTIEERDEHERAQWGAYAEAQLELNRTPNAMNEHALICELRKARREHAAKQRARRSLRSLFGR